MPAAADVDGVQLTMLDTLPHGLAGDAEPADGFAHGQEAIGNGVGDAALELVAEADPPGCAGGDLLARDEAILEPAQDGGWGDVEKPCRLADIEQCASVVGSAALARGIFR